jgi:integrase
VRFRREGVHVRWGAGTTKKVEALALLAKPIEERAQTTCGEPAARRLLTETMERFFEETALRVGTVEAHRYNSRVLTRSLGHPHLDEIDRRALAEFVTSRKRTGVTDAIIRRDCALIGSIVTAAIRWSWAATSPVPRLNKKALEKSNARTRFPTRAEFARLRGAASDDLKPISVLAVLTGLRTEEFLGLTLASIDLRRRELRLTVTRTGRAEAGAAVAESVGNDQGASRTLPASVALPVLQAGWGAGRRSEKGVRGSVSPIWDRGLPLPRPKAQLRQLVRAGWGRPVPAQPHPWARHASDDGPLRALNDFRTARRA